MMRIRFLHTRYPHWGGRSGFPQLVRHLDPARFATVLDGASDSDADFPGWLEPLRPWARRRIAQGGMPWYKLSDMAAEMRAAVARQEVVHFLDGEHSGQFLPRLRFGRTRFVASYHQPAEMLEHLVPGRVIAAMDAVTVLSPAQVPFFRRHLPEERIHLIPHGIDTGFFHPPPERPAGPRLRCITVGHWLRDWPCLRRIAEAVPEVDFDVVTGQDTGLEGLPNVFRHRGLSDEALAGLYRAADVLMLPLTDSTANNALLEGIASGLPVLSTEIPGVRFHLGDAEAVLAPVGAAEALVEALRRLQADPALRRHLGESARRRAEQLAWPAVAARFGAIYEQAVRPSAENRRAVDLAPIERRGGARLS